MAIKRVRNSEELEISLLGFLYEQPMQVNELYKEISDLSVFGFVWRVKMGAFICHAPSPGRK
jgi:DNA-binding PadR family transcriptional regulator